MTSIHSEREATFEGPGVLDPDALERLPGVERVRNEPPEVLEALYYDTADLRLLAHGITLRRRSGGADEGWHVKLPDGDGDGRDIHAPLRSGTVGDVPGALERHLKAYTRGADVLPVVHLRTHRLRHLLLDDGDRRLAEVSQDRVAAQVLDSDRLHPASSGGTELFGYNAPVAGRQRAGALRPGGRYPGDGTAAQLVHWSEIDVERREGGDELMDAAASLLTRGGWHSSASTRKIDHALADELPAEFGRRGPWRRPRVGSAGDVVMRRFGEQFQVLLACDAAARADEPDAVHRMRSTCRRLRSLLRGSRSLFDPARSDEVVEGLGWLTGALAGSRDHEVLRERFRRQAGELGGADGEALAHRITGQETRRHEAAQRAAVTALDSPRYHRLLGAMEELRERPQLDWPKADRPAVRHLRKVARRDRRRLTRRMAAVESAEPGPARDAALHQARKAARRARYTAETALPYAGGKSAARFRKRTKAVQQILGDHQDAVMAREELANLAAEAHANGVDTYGYGRLHARQDELAREARDALPDAWKRLRDPKLVRF